MGNFIEISRIAFCVMSPLRQDAITIKKNDKMHHAKSNAIDFNKIVYTWTALSFDDLRSK